MGQSYDSRLGRGVVRPDSPACLCSDRRQVDDPSPLSLSHTTYHSLRYQEDRLEIDGEHFVPFRIRNLLQLARMGNRRIVYEDVDAAEFRFNIRDHALHVGGDRYIGPHCYCLASRAHDLATHAIRSVGSFTVVHSNIGTSRSQCDCDCCSDSATAARHKGDSILQVFHGFILRFVLCPSIRQHPTTHTRCSRQRAQSTMWT